MLSKVSPSFCLSFFQIVQLRCPCGVSPKRNSSFTFVLSRYKAQRNIQQQLGNIFSIEDFLFSEYCPSVRVRFGYHSQYQHVLFLSLELSYFARFVILTGSLWKPQNHIILSRWNVGRVDKKSLASRLITPFVVSPFPRQGSDSWFLGCELICFAKLYYTWIG